MSDITRITTLGIGPAGTIDGFILVGLNPAIVFSGLRKATAKRDMSALDVATREAIYSPELMTLEDGSGYWLFEDGTRIMFEAGNENEPGEVKRYMGVTKVKRNG